jgi:hypothetical protein
MTKRNLKPIVNTEIHFFVKEKILYGISISNSTPLREVDFDEDIWRQECQFLIEPID